MASTFYKLFVFILYLRAVLFSLGNVYLVYSQ